MLLRHRVSGKIAVPLTAAAAAPGASSGSRLHNRHSPDESGPQRTNVRGNYRFEPLVMIRILLDLR
jgi:hypothetical protein